jgi:hypothetical protein
MAQGTNPFYVDPTGGVQPYGLQALGSGLQQLGQSVQAKRAAATEAQRLAEIKTQAGDIFRSGDMDALAEFSIANPELGQMVSEQIGFRNEATKSNYINSMLRALEDPKEIPKTILARQAFLKSQGLGPEETEITDGALQQYQEDPEQFMKGLESELIILAGEKYKSYKELAAEPEEDVTADIENFEYYAKLYESDPAMADKFAVQVGITPADNYESLMAELEMMKLRQEVTAGEVEAVEKVEAKEAAETAKVEAMETSQVNLERTLGQIDDIVTSIQETPLTTGFAGMALGKIPGTEAYGIRGDIELIKSKLALDMIKEMKQQSATGATGFGAMSEKELALIQSAVDRLDADMDKPRVLESLNEIKEHYTRWKEYNDKALAEEAEMGINGSVTVEDSSVMSDDDLLKSLGI